MGRQLLGKRTFFFEKGCTMANFQIEDGVPVVRESLNIFEKKINYKREISENSSDEIIDPHVLFESIAQSNCKISSKVMFNFCPVSESSNKNVKTIIHRKHGLEVLIKVICLGLRKFKGLILNR